MSKFNKKDFVLQNKVEEAIEEEEDEEVDGSYSEPEGSAVDSSEEEEEEDQPNEEDMKFINDNADEDEEEEEEDDDDIVSKKKRPLENVKEESEEDIDEDDLALIQENTGVQVLPSKKRNFKRIKRKAEEKLASRKADHDLEKLFESDEEKPKATPNRRAVDENEDEDDLDDFIEYDDDEDHGSENEEERRQIRAMKRRQMLLESKDFESSMGISKEAWRDIQEIFGDGYDYEYAFKETSIEEDVNEGIEQVKISEHFEPALISAKFITVQDEEIKLKDVPERMQNALLDIQVDLEVEARWILSQLQRMNPFHGENPDKSLQCVHKILRFINEEYFEVPFIGSHRKEFFNGILNFEELWLIYDMNEDYKHITSRRTKLRQWVQKVPTLTEVERNSLDSQFEFVMNEHDLNDIQDYLMLHYSEYILQDDEDGKFRRPVKRDMYSICKSRNIPDFDMGIDSNHVGVNIRDNYKMHTPRTFTAEPEASMDTFLCEEFNTIEKVRRAVVFSKAIELFNDLTFRKAFENIFNQYVVVNACPTEKGMQEIDQFHEFAPVKFLTNKPVYDFKGYQFCELMKAEKSNDITLEFKFELESGVKRSIYSLIHSDSNDEMSEQWNKLRNAILDHAIEQFLKPHFLKRIRDDLEKRSMESLAVACQLNLQDKIMMGGYSEGQSGFPRVLAISNGEGKFTSPTVVAMINEYGTVIDHLKLGSLIESRTEKDKDYEILEQFILNRKPDVIAVSGYGIGVRNLYMNLEKHLPNSGVDVKITFVEDDIARLYQNTAASHKEFPNYSTLLRYCVSIARKVQDPLSEYASLCNPKNDILALELHHWQSLLPEDIYLKFVYRSLVNVVNLVGVDINRALNYPHTQGLLQFVCGLGPRKANYLVKKILSLGSKLERRSQLVTNGIFGTHVFMNCSSFLRITPQFINEKHPNLDVLDSTRIHPENYELARKMAADALDVEIDKDKDNEDDNPSQYVEDVMQNPDQLDVLLLDEFANELSKRNLIKFITLIDIKEELKSPYNERRRPFLGITESKLFTMLTGETDFSLIPGQIIALPISKVSSKFISCRFESGLIGTIPFKYLSDGGSASGNELGLKPNQVVKCRVMNVEKDRMNVELSIRPSDVNTKPVPFKRIDYDPYYDFTLESNAEEKKRKEEHAERNKGNYVHRFISHPMFKNVPRSVAEESLKNMNIGDLVIRPSSQGKNYLVITWKFFENLYQHVIVEERDKESDWELGKALYVNGEKFDDLDEILSRYIDPMVEFVHETIKHRKFVKDGNVKERIDQEKQVNPRSIPYFISVSKEFPGKFVLSFQPGNRLHQEFITVTNNGFKLRKEFFESLEELLTWFKQNYNKQASVPAPEFSQRIYGAPAYQSSYSDHRNDGYRRR